MHPTPVPKRPIADLLLGKIGWLVVGVAWSIAVGASLLISIVVLPTAAGPFIASHAMAYLLGLALMEAMWLGARQDHRLAKKALYAAHAAETKLARVAAEATHLMSAGVPMTITDLDYTTIRANKAYLELTGREAKDVIGKPCHELHHSCVCESEDCPLEQLIEGVRRASLDVNLKVDGGTIPATATATPLLDHKGRLLGMIEVFCDNRELAKARHEVSRVRAEIAKIQSQELHN